MSTLRELGIMVLVLTIFCFVLHETKRVNPPAGAINIDREFYYFTLEDVDVEQQMFYIRLGEPLMNGSDGSCQYAGVIMNEILEDNPEWKIMITNEGWVPSARNPVDLEWSRTLAEGY